VAVIGFPFDEPFFLPFLQARLDCCCLIVTPHCVLHLTTHDKILLIPRLISYIWQLEFYDKIDAGSICIRLNLSDLIEWLPLLIALMNRPV
jgi:hypothetical protein